MRCISADLQTYFFESWVFCHVLVLARFQDNFQLIHPKLLNISIMCSMVVVDTYIR